MALRRSRRLSALAATYTGILRKAKRVCFERFALEPLPVESVVTVGYNVTAPTVERLPTCNSLARLPDGPPPGHAIVRSKAFSVNYADVTIRWGLYESAIKYVGYPICPNFDFAGVVERVGPGASVQEGDTVVGITFFGAYSERVLVPCHQLFAVPRVHRSPPKGAREGSRWRLDGPSRRHGGTFRSAGVI